MLVSGRVRCCFPGQKIPGPWVFLKENLNFVTQKLNAVTEVAGKIEIHV